MLKALSGPACLAKAHLRVACPTDNLTDIVQFYRTDSAFRCCTISTTIDGVMLGHKAR